MSRKENAVGDGANAPAFATKREVQPKARHSSTTAQAARQMESYVTVAEAAELLCVDPKTVRNRIGSGDLEAYRHGRRVVIPLAAIERLIKRGRM